MGKIGAFMRLTRAEHSLMLVIAVLAAELVVAGRLPLALPLALSLLTPIAVSMGSFAINDYFDVEADKANGLTKRPIVAGEFTKEGAFRIAIALLVIGPLFSLFINVYAFVIAVIFSALAFLYSYRLKDMLFVGNIYIALSMAIPLIYGNFVITGSPQISPAIILGSIVIFLAGLAREIHGMVRDTEGDRKARGSKNLVHHTGKGKSNWMALILYAEAVFVSIYMFFLYKPFAYNLAYMIPIAVVDAVLMYVAVEHMYRDDKKFYRFSRNVTLVAMSVAILVFLVSAVVYIKI